MNGTTPVDALVQRAFARLLATHGTLTEAARAHRLSVQYLSNARAGNVKCGPKILKALGLTRSFAKVRK